MNLKIIAVILVILAGIIGIGVFGEDPETATTNNDIPANTFGESPANIRVVEVGDFECPACASFYTIFSQVKEEYKDRVVFEFKHFPLTSIHPNAFAAHRAAQAAALQGKFWEMHDLLFEQRSSWVSQTTNDPVAQFESFAEQLELDMEKFRLDYSSSAVNDFIQSNISDARALGAEATPTFYINGELVENRDLDSVEKFSAILDQELRDAGVGVDGDESSEAETTPTEDTNQ